MLEVDFHSHTFFSTCGIHTHIEMLTRAKELGMKGLAITDHGPALQSRFTAPFYDRLKNPVAGIRFIKGIECNILDDTGVIDIIDVPARSACHFELVLAGFHPNSPRNMGVEKNTDVMIAALRKNPCIDVISHPNDMEYPLDIERLALVAKEHGAALELNNSKVLYNRTTAESAVHLIRVCKKAGCSIVISSDAHAIEEIGLDDSVRPFIIQEQFPRDLIINDTAAGAFRFIDARRGNKENLCGR